MLVSALTRSIQSTALEWKHALRQAVEQSDRPVRLFLEYRQDLTVELYGEDPPSSTRSSWSGVAATRLEAPSRIVYRSDPSIEELEHLVRVASENRLRVPGSGGGSGRRPATDHPDLDESKALAPLHRVAGWIRGRDPRALVLGRCVAFDQRVWIAGGPADPAEDLRRAMRLRIETHLQRASRESSAVVEAVRPPSAVGFDGETLDGLARVLLERAEQRLDAEDPPDGESSVVLAPGVGGVLIHEIVGHALEADVALSRGSWLTDLDGEVAPRELVIVDDPRRGRAAWRCDDEGQPSRATRLVGDGRVTGWLHDVTTAQRLSSPPTGHGRRSSFREPVRPRMGCTFIGAGRWQAEEILRSVDRGIYVRRMEAATVDLQSGRAVFRVTDADRIVRGKIDAPLRAHLLVIDGRRVLAGLERVADDLAFDTCVGSCHRDGQPLAISVGAPTIWAGVCKVVAANGAYGVGG